MIDSVYQAFGNKLRVRICGICVDDNKLLMINHLGVREGDFWSPPGGGLQFGETAEDCLKREFEEETGLQIDIEEFLFICEFMHTPLHALEIFFLVNMVKGNLRKGNDPELADHQIINDVKFMPWDEIDHLSPASKHGIFNLSSKSSKIVDLRGYFKL